MASSRWHPLNPMWSTLNQLQSGLEQMNRAFSRWSDEGQVGGFVPYPAVNAWEDGDQAFVTAELPGLRMEDLEIYVTGSDQLTVKGERKPQLPERALRHRQERGFGKFTRTLQLPFAVDPDRVEARLEHGVLSLKLAKHESAKARKIPVRGE